MKFVSPCWKPSVEGENSSNRGDVSGRVSGLLWYKDSGQHVNGEFSMAIIQANNLLEDHSQLESGSMSSSESGPHGTFVGIYDGHGGPETARFINDHLFNNIKSKLFFHHLLYESIFANCLRLCNLLIYWLDCYCIL